MTMVNETIRVRMRTTLENGVLRNLVSCPDPTSCELGGVWARDNTLTIFHTSVLILVYKFHVLSANATIFKFAWCKALIQGMLVC